MCYKTSVLNQTAFVVKKIDEHIIFMKNNEIKIDGVPAVVYGEKSDKLFICVHGLCGNKNEAEKFAEVAQYGGYQILSVDLPEHGGRMDGKKLLPWEVVPELRAIVEYAKTKWKEINVRAVSIGAYFSLLSFIGYDVKKCLLVSPLTDMVEIIGGMMKAAGVSEKELEEKGEIRTDFGQTLSWKYLCFARKNPVCKIGSDTRILCAENDEVVPHFTVKNFAKKYGCDLDVYENGEHFFHTETQVAYMRKWENVALYGMNLDEIHTTEAGKIRICRNLGTDTDPVEYCKKIIASGNCKRERKGKNVYFATNKAEITLNASAKSIVTAHKITALKVKK